MNPADLKSVDTPQEQLLKIRHVLVDRIWQGMVVVALVGAPASVSRAFSTGWMLLYGIHIGLAVLVVAVYWFRARISFAVKSALILLIFWAIGLTGVFTLGILGSGYWWLVLSSLLVSTLFSIRAGVVCAVVVTAILAAAGAGFTSGWLKVAVDANVFIASAATWTTLVIATILTPFIVFQAIAAYQQTTLELLDEVHKQRDLIQQLATHDQLTGLPLLRLAADRLQISLHIARRAGNKVALLFIDLDGFKRVNDSLGHAAGDHVLKEVAGRLLKSVRAEDTAARVGGLERAQESLRQIRESLASRSEARGLRGLFDRRIRFIMLIAFGLAFFQQITGINAIFYYLPTIFAQAGECCLVRIPQRCVINAGEV
jgi:GGDEF domain-containing protein